MLTGTQQHASNEAAGELAKKAAATTDTSPRSMLVATGKALIRHAIPDPPCNTHLTSYTKAYPGKQTAKLLQTEQTSYFWPAYD